MEDKPETKEKEKTDKPKPTGKLDFFKKAEKTKDTKDAGKAKEIKKEPVADPKKKMFFSNPKPPAKAATKAPSPAPSDSSTKEKEKEASKEKEKEVPASAVSFSLLTSGHTRIHYTLDLERRQEKIIRRSRKREGANTQECQHRFFQI